MDEMADFKRDFDIKAILENKKFKQVLRVRDKTYDHMDQVLVIKVCKHPGHDHLHFCEDLAREYQILHKINHPNIIRPIEFFSELLNNNSYCQLKLPSYDQDLYGHLSEQFPIINLVFIRDIFTQLIRALKYLHYQGRRGHFDIKPQNILIKDSSTAILIDFELSYRYDKITLETLRLILNDRNPEYLPPEILKVQKNLKNGQTHKIMVEKMDWEGFDVFSLGVTLYSAIFFSSPFKNGKALKNDPDYQHIVNKNFNKFWESNQQTAKILRKISQEGENIGHIQKLVYDMLSFESKNRPRLKHLLKY